MHPVPYFAIFAPWREKKEVNMDTDQIMQIVYLVAILAVVWIVLRIVLKLAAKVFACGCSVIVVIGIIAYLVRYFGNM